ncbi:MAG: hypothetical protein AB8F34_12695 [Akkermansiaceae bacterium]
MKKQGMLYATGGIVLGAVTAFGVIQMQSNSSDEAEAKSVKADQFPAANKRDIARYKGRVADESRLAKRARGALGLSSEEADNLLSEDSPEAKAQREKLKQDLKKRQLAQLTNKMAKWGAALGLDEEQKGKLLDLADGQMDELEKLAVDASESQDPAQLSESAKRAMSIISGKALEESMLETLTPAQKEKYQAFKKQQNQNKAEVSALRELAGIQENLMLTPEQRNGVYSVLYEDAAKKAAQDQGGVESVIQSVASSAGVTIDPAMQGIMSSLANRGLEELASGREIDAEAARQIAEQVTKTALDQQVNRFSSVMTPAQLELYRTQLEDRMSGLRSQIEEPSGSE